MKIIHIADKISDADGVSTHLLQLIPSLSEAGVLQRLVCGKMDSKKKFAEAGIEVIELPEFLHANRSAANFGKAVKLLYRIAKEFRAEIVHSHSHYAANIAWYSSKFTGIRTVQTIHGLIPNVGRISHFKAHKFICVSETGYYYLKHKIGIKEKDLYLIRQGVKYSNAEQPERFRDERLRVTCVSRLETEKGVDTFVKAAGMLSSRGLSIDFSLAGSGSQLSALKKLNEDHDSAILFLGEIIDVPEHLRGVDILVMPSREKNEGFPMIIAEAGVSGCLIISSRFHSLEYVFDESNDGYTFDIDNFKQLSDLIMHAYKNREEALNRSKTFQKKALTLFDIRQLADNHLKVYNG
jgi:glycosyltransferase involved in cell wall biosynthesis